MKGLAMFLLSAELYSAYGKLGARSRVKTGAFAPSKSLRKRA